MLRLLLVLGTCALPACSMAATFSPEHEITGSTLTGNEKTKLLFAYEPSPVTAKDLQKRPTQSAALRKKVTSVFQVEQAPAGFGPPSPPTPVLLRFETPPYPTVHASAKARKEPSSARDAVLIVPLASSYVFMLTFLMLALVAKQKDYLQCVGVYKRLFLNLKRARTV